jgi:NAD(P)-dependent dehydrogenase (short-subunit alcohol dehydrogenase family)
MESTPVYLLIGGAGTIGAATARQLHAERARIVLAGRREEPLATLAAELGGAHVVLDATDADAVERAGTEALERFGRLDGLANFAGSILLKPAHLTRPDEFAQVLAQNLVTAFNVVRAAGKLVKGAGSVVLMSSAAGRTGLPNHEAIAAAKAGVIGLALSAAATYAAKGVRVNCVAPGLTSTPLTARIVGNEASLKASVAMHANGRIGEAQDVASAIEWLINPRQRHVTGQVIAVDGGLGSLRPR